jgi:integrase
MAGRRQFGRIRLLPSGRWQIRYPSPEGIEQPGPRTFPTKAEASRFLAKIETDIDRGVWADPVLGRITVREWANRYLPTMTHLKPKTRAGYDSLLKATILPVLGDVPLGKLRPIIVQEWLAGLTTRGLSPSRARQAYRLLSQLLAAAEDSGLVVSNPCRRIRLPRLSESEPVILTHDQVSALVASCPAQYEPLVEGLAYGGLRIGEALALRRNCVDLLGRRIIVRESLSDANGQLSFQSPKTHQQRSLTLPRFLIDRLEKHLDQYVAADPRALLFVGATGEPLRYSSFLRRVWRPAIAASGLSGVTPHDLRATHPSWVIDEGGSVMDAAARLGHAAGTVTTRHYARPVLGETPRSPTDSTAPPAHVGQRLAGTKGHAEGT